MGQGGYLEREPRVHRGMGGPRVEDRPRDVDMYERGGAMYGNGRETNFTRIESRSTNESSNRYCCVIILDCQIKPADLF